MITFSTDRLDDLPAGLTVIRWDTPIEGLTQRIEHLDDEYVCRLEHDEIPYTEKAEAREAQRIVNKISYIRMCLKASEAIRDQFDRGNEHLRERLKFVDQYRRDVHPATLMEDFAPLSMKFSIHHFGGGHMFHGGIIFHGQASQEQVRKHQDDADKLRDIIDPQNGWSIHT
ncbi:MAG: hypothetical protein ABEN55_21080 [Bradymonadaceae bacterium]